MSMSSEHIRPQKTSTFQILLKIEISYSFSEDVPELEKHEEINSKSKENF